MLVGRSVGLHLPLWMIPLEEGPDPDVPLGCCWGWSLALQSWQQLGSIRAQALSPNQACPLPTKPSPAAAPGGPPSRVWALGPATEEQPQGETMGSVFKSKDSFFFRTEKNSPSTEKEVLFL